MFLRFCILACVHSSENSAVYRCADYLQQCTVAIKVVGSQKTAVDEVCALGALDHPNVIPLCDLVEVDGGVGMVMPFMDMNLAEFMDRGRYSGRCIRSIQLQSMRGVAHMHSRHIMHMDLKPANIGITSATDGVFVRILDLGSAVVASRLQVGDQVRTTPGFSAPELQQGVIGFPADVYSMGKVFQSLRERINEPQNHVEDEMTAADPSRRPTSGDIVVRLEGGVLAVDGPFWRSEIASMLDGDPQKLLGSDRLNQLVALVCRGMEHLDNAFWLLQEEARRQGLMVMEILHYFHVRMHASRLAGYFYARAVEFLSHLPGFTLTADIRMQLWLVSSSAACERAVVRILSRVEDPSLLEWCCALERPWGSRQDPFGAFVLRLAKDPLCQAELAELSTRLG